MTTAEGLGWISIDMPRQQLAYVVNALSLTQHELSDPARADALVQEDDFPVIAKAREKLARNLAEADDRAERYLARLAKDPEGPRPSTLPNSMEMAWVTLPPHWCIPVGRACREVSRLFADREQAGPADVAAFADRLRELLVVRQQLLQRLREGRRS